MATIELIVVMLVVILVPGIPAFVLYSYLPAKTVVTGPFHGLQLQLTGAFAGYFLVLLLVTAFTFKFTSDQRKSDEYETWMVRGQLATDPNSPDISFSDANVTVSPPLQHIEKDGSFWVVVPLQRGHYGRATVVQIERPPFGTAIIHLGKEARASRIGTSYKLTYDDAHRTIVVDTPVVLVAPPAKYGEAPAYQPQLLP